MFMRKLMRLGVMAMGLALAVMLTAPAMANDITVGEFVQQLARAKNLNANDARTAADALASVGIQLPTLDYNTILTEGEVASIARSAGLNVRTATPAANFDSRKASRFFSSFAGELRTSSQVREDRIRDGRIKGSDEDGDPEAPNGKGKGKGKGKGGVSPSEPD
jgi:hypothetical protein